MIHALVFDFNGVLIDDEDVHFDLFREVLAEEGVFITPEMYHTRYLGYDDRKCLEVALTDGGKHPDPALVDDLIARKAVRYLQRAEKGLPYFPYAAETLQRLGAHYPIAICSGALLQEIVCALRYLKVEPLVPVIIPAEDTEFCKPHPDGYLRALAGLRNVQFPQNPRSFRELAADECLVIEDSLAGIQAARGAGMHAIGIATTYNAAQLRGAGAEDVITGLETFTQDWIQARFP